MSYLIYVLPAMLIGMICLILTCMIFRSSKQSLTAAFQEGVVWSVCFVIASGAETLVLGNI